MRFALWKNAETKDAFVPAFLLLTGERSVQILGRKLSPASFTANKRRERLKAILLHLSKAVETYPVSKHSDYWKSIFSILFLLHFHKP
jgi:hypothetical protein